jgi:hypothetical protein
MRKKSDHEVSSSVIDMGWLYKLPSHSSQTFQTLKVRPQIRVGTLRTNRPVTQSHMTDERLPQPHGCKGLRAHSSHHVASGSIVNIMENIISIVSAEVQMCSDTDLVTLGLCVHVATDAAEQSSPYSVLISEFCSSSAQTQGP